MREIITVEEAFRMGAEAMRSRIAALEMVANRFESAQKILGLDIPKFEIPERVTISGKEE